MMVTLTCTYSFVGASICVYFPKTQKFVRTGSTYSVVHNYNSSNHPNLYSKPKSTYE